MVPRTPFLVFCSLGLSKAPSLCEESGGCFHLGGRGWWCFVGVLCGGGDGGRSNRTRRACCWPPRLSGGSAGLNASTRLETSRWGPGFPVPHQLPPQHHYYPLQTPWAGALRTSEQAEGLTCAECSHSPWRLGTRLAPLEPPRWRWASHTAVPSSPQVTKRRIRIPELSLLWLESFEAPILFLV